MHQHVALLELACCCKVENRMRSIHNCSVESIEVSRAPHQKRPCYGTDIKKSPLYILKLS